MIWTFTILWLSPIIPFTETEIIGGSNDIFNCLFLKWTTFNPCDHKLWLNCFLIQCHQGKSYQPEFCPSFRLNVKINLAVVEKLSGRKCVTAYLCVDLIPLKTPHWALPLLCWAAESNNCDVFGWDDSFCACTSNLPTPWTLVISPSSSDYRL